MKYTIHINQGAIADHGLAEKTDLVDWAIVDYVKAWQANPKAERYDQMIWFNFKKFIEEMPLLGIKSKGAVSKRIKKLYDLNLLDVHQMSDNRIFVSLSQFCVDVIMFKNSSSNKGRGCFPRETGVSQSEQGVSCGKQGVSDGKHSTVHHLTVHQKQEKEIKEVFEFWKSEHNHKRSVLDDSRKNIIKKALKNFSIDDLKLAITGCKKSKYHQGENDEGKVYDNLGLILRNAEKIEQFIGYNSQSTPKSKTNITSEIIARISQGSQAAYQWQSDDARQIFERLRHGPNGVPWTGTEFEIRAAIKGVMS